MHELDEYCEQIEFNLNQAEAEALGLKERSSHSHHYIPPLLTFAFLLLFFF
ncbi:hypothetical protein BIZ37_09045 [Photobacterium sp. BZF1]|uniref:hypothetical protein n=1 Tax=Photobacterium TaxID=657 RepID=UPI001653A04D|nr:MULTISPECIES: hypothetical protein [Photobacterium]MBC7002701.1 hypothetical protein [Photobacterium sp. BZF1]MBY5945905.1 hypothetical protein [Photobacterium rosenbergii]